MSYVKDFRVQFSDSPSVDVFGRSRVSHPESIFGSKLIVDNQPLIWDDQTTAGSASSSYNTNQSSVTLGVTAGGGTGTRIRQTFRKFNYIPGKSFAIFMTGVMGTEVSGAIKRIGFFDDNNGFYFEQSGSTYRVVKRSSTSGSPVNTEIDQSSWNLDIFDGTGPSGITLDLTLAQIFVIDFQWLGTGRIRMGFDLGGVLYYCHEFLTGNISSLVSISNPNLPLRYELNSSSAVTASLTCICSTVIVEGGNSIYNNEFTIDRGITGLTTNNDSNLYPLIALRYRSGYESSDVSIYKMDLVCGTTSLFRWAIILNPTVTGTAFSFSAITNSPMEADVATTNATTVSNGVVIGSGYDNQGGSSASIRFSPFLDTKLGVSISGTRDILVLAVQRITGTTETFYGAIGFKSSV